MTKFISVKDGLPPNDHPGYLLIAYTEWCHKIVTCGIYLHGKWIDEIRGRHEIKAPKKIVTHWCEMPLHPEYDNSLQKFLKSEITIEKFHE